MGVFFYKTIGGCTYWFTAALVVAELLIMLMLLSRRKCIWFYVVISCLVFVIGYFIASNNISLINKYPSLPWQYKHGMYAIPYMALGGLYWRYEQCVRKIFNKYTLPVMIVIYVAALIWKPEEFRVLVSILDVNIPGIVLSLLSTVILIEMCKQLPSMNLSDYVGQNTIGFYFMSGALPIVLSMIVNRFMTETNILGLIIVFVGSFVIGLCAVYLMNRFVPWLFDLRVLWKKQEK